MHRFSSLEVSRINVLVTSLDMIIYHGINVARDRFAILTPLCDPQRGIYATFLLFRKIVMYSLAPSSLMLFFGLLTLRHLRQRRLVVATSDEINRTGRRSNTQLIRMLTVLVFVVITFTFPMSVSQFYLSFAR